MKVDSDLERDGALQDAKDAANEDKHQSQEKNANLARNAKPLCLEDLKELTIFIEKRCKGR